MTPYIFTNRPVAKALYLALTHDPFYITLEKKSSANLEAAREAMFRYLDYAILEAAEHGRLTLPQDQTSGAAIWSIPQDRQTQAKLSENKKDFIQTQMGKDSLKAYIEIVDFMSRESENVVAENAWYLSILGILPEYQGKGMGKALMLPVLREADDWNLSIFAESFTPENFGFYTALGFEKAKTIEEPVTKSNYTILVRPAAKQEEI